MSPLVYIFISLISFIVGVSFFVIAHPHRFAFILAISLTARKQSAARMSANVRRRHVSLATRAQETSEILFAATLSAIDCLTTITSIYVSRKRWCWYRCRYFAELKSVLEKKQKAKYLSQFLIPFWIELRWILIKRCFCNLKTWVILAANLLLYIFFDQIFINKYFFRFFVSEDAIMESEINHLSQVFKCQH